MSGTFLEQKMNSENIVGSWTRMELQNRGCDCPPARDQHWAPSSGPFGQGTENRISVREVVAVSCEVYEVPGKQFVRDFSDIRGVI